MIAVYPGTFDPITLGHLDIIIRSSKLCERLIIGVAEQTTKTPLFSLEERSDMVFQAVQEFLPFSAESIVVLEFSGLLIDFAMQMKARAIIRGLRAVSDFEYEFKMAYVNRKLCPEIETIMLPADDMGHFISSSTVKDIARLGGDVSRFVSPYVTRLLVKRFLDRI